MFVVFLLMKTIAHQNVRMMMEEGRCCQSGWYASRCRVQGEMCGGAPNSGALQGDGVFLKLLACRRYASILHVDDISAKRSNIVLTSVRTHERFD